MPKWDVLARFNRNNEINNNALNQLLQKQPMRPWNYVFKAFIYPEYVFTLLKSFFHKQLLVKPNKMYTNGGHLCLSKAFIWWLTALKDLTAHYIPTYTWSLVLVHDHLIGKNLHGTFCPWERVGYVWMRGQYGKFTRELSTSSFSDEAHREGGCMFSNEPSSLAGGQWISHSFKLGWCLLLLLQVNYKFSHF